MFVFVLVVGVWILGCCVQAGVCEHPQQSRTVLGNLFDFDTVRVCESPKTFVFTFLIPSWFGGHVC